MKKVLVFSVFCLLLLVSFASAKITIIEPLDVYSLGDNLDLTTTVEPKSVAGFFEIKLICENSSLNIYRVPTEPSFLYEEEQTIPTYIILTKEMIGDLIGNCHLLASIGKEQATTKNFVISDSVTITPSLDKENYDPGEAITLNIEIIKANSHPLNGFIEVSGATDFSKAVVDGLVTETFTMSETIEAGKYTLNLFAYDRDENNAILNNGKISISFNINQIPTYIETSLSKLEVTPGQNFSFGSDLHDQSGKIMNRTLSVTILSPENEETQLTLDSGEIHPLILPLNSPPGKYKILSSFEQVSDEKTFTLKELQKVKFDFLGSVLIIKNIGNTLYNKTIEVQIGEETQILNLNLEVGEERRFNLKAPEGEYEVIVMDDTDSAEKTLLLTGKAISVEDLKRIGILARYPFVWVFIVLVLASFSFILFFRFKKKTFKLKDKIGKVKQSVSHSHEKQDEKILDITEPEVGNAESTLVLKGEKTNSVVIDLKINNYSDLGKPGLEKLKNILETVKETKGMLEQKQEHFLIVFSPLVTKTFDNEILAVKTGINLLSKLQEYNKKSVDKIEFGISANSGDLITNLEDKKLKYTSVGNTILVARKIADSAKGKLLVSEKIRKKLLRDVKAEKSGQIGNTKIYEVEKVTDKEANKEKLQDILHRMKREEKHDKKN